jgi:hypothetical protein
MVSKFLDNADYGATFVFGENFTEHFFAFKVEYFKILLNSSGTIYNYILCIFYKSPLLFGGTSSSCEMFWVRIYTCLQYFWGRGSGGGRQHVCRTGNLNLSSCDFLDRISIDDKDLP